MYFFLFAPIFASLLRALFLNIILHSDRRKFCIENLTILCIELNITQMGKFNIGDVVKLKSGSPKMTVELVETDQITCIWFDSEGVKRASFHPETIV